MEINQDLGVGGRWEGAASVWGGSLVLWLAMCFSGTAALKWMPQQLKLKSGTSITKEKNRLSTLGLITYSPVPGDGGINIPTVLPVKV